MTTPFPKHLRSLDTAMRKFKKERLKELKKTFPPWYAIWGESLFGRVAFCIAVYIVVNSAILWPIYLLGVDVLTGQMWGGLCFFSVLLSTLAVIRAYKMAIHLCDDAINAPFRVYDYRHRKNRRQAIKKVSDERDLATAAVDELKSMLVQEAPHDLGMAFRPVPVDSTRVRIVHELEAVRTAVYEAYDPKSPEEYANIDGYIESSVKTWRRAMMDYQTIAGRVEGCGKGEKD